jgi:tetratricopeptide (TPR) repeat protein
LVSRDASNSAWQNDLSWSYQEIGDVLMARNKFHEALQNYQGSLAIAERLASADPTNNNWQSDLAIILEKTGETFTAEGKSAEALQEFRDSLAICEKLTQADPKNAEWATEEALALFQVGMTVSRTEGSANSEVRAMLTRARDILLELRQRSSPSALNQSRLEEIQTALSNL